MVASTSMKEYLKRYQSKSEEEEKKRKKKKKQAKPDTAAVLVVDEDPVWQKPVNIEEGEPTESPDEMPVVDEDIEVKRMRRLEQIKRIRAYDAIAEDGSGWVSVSSTCASSVNLDSDISPPRKERTRKDTPSPEPRMRPSGGGREDEDLSPPRKAQSTILNSDLSPPRKRSARNDITSPRPKTKPESEDTDFSPPRKRMARKDSHSPEYRHGTMIKEADLSPPRSRRAGKEMPAPGLGPNQAREDADLSPARKRKGWDDMLSPQHRLKPPREGTVLSPLKNHRARYESLSPEGRKNVDLSPPRWRHRQHHTPSPDLLTLPHESCKSRPHDAEDIVQKRSASCVSPDSDLSHLRKSRKAAPDLSPPRKDRKELTQSSVKDKRKTGLISGTEIREEISKIKKDDWSRFENMDPSMTGRGAEPVYRGKAGQRISKEEYLKSQQKVEEKPKEKKLEWGKGLAQKREAEARLQELELEKDKPFARTRDDPELDRMMKERVRWGDPMAHVVKRKQSEPVLQDLGENERMKESGFVIPQDIPNHSWLKRGLDAAPNRYGIRPGRHWDGVDRSNGFEKGLIKRMNEKRATDREAYLWSVSDM